MIFIKPIDAMAPALDSQASAAIVVALSRAAVSVDTAKPCASDEARAAQASFLAVHAAKNYVPLNPRARHLAAPGDWRRRLRPWPR